ncbi:SLC13 family permease [Hominifimenecus sp. rT4P-3]|uniref:SLC13 family permease n=1 Tax=Hominifimenecus sp. rT4P-3 TaxID=3242979 RepID=UPI003DA3AFA6
MSVNVIITLIMLLAIIVLIFKSPASPGVIMTGVPIIAALLMGFGLKEVNGFIGNGLKSVSGTLFLMVFAVLYFGILTEAGIFKALIKFIMRFLGNSILGSMLVTAVLAMASQLSGSGATCALCTLPTMRPVFEKQKIRMPALLLIQSIASGVICLMPWAPGINEASSYVGVDVYDVFLFLRPLIIFSIICVLLLCIPVSIIEKKKGAGMSKEEFDQLKQELNQPLELPFGKGIAIFDGVFTVILLVALLAGKVSSNLGFAFGYVVLLMVNYHSAKERGEYLKRHSSQAMNMAFTMLGVAVLVGVNQGTEALNELANLIAGTSNASLLAHLPFVLCILSMLLSITIGGTKNSVVLPAIIPIVTSLNLGFTPVQVMGAIFATGVISANLNLFNASPYLALSLAGGVEMKDHLKYSLVPIYGFSLLMLAFMVVTGMLPI